LNDSIFCIKLLTGLSSEMGYLIDGHNLIPKIPGMNLDQMDDETDLIGILQSFCAAKQKDAVVFFDGAPPGYDGTRSYGRVTAVFVRQGKTADSAIREYLHQLGKAAKNWVVVTSDRQILSEARTMGAGMLSSTAFSQQIVTASGACPKGKKGTEAMLSEDELKDWMDLFGLKSDE
jgi:predicted RNA-binding protein with PIN domain